MPLTIKCVLFPIRFTLANPVLRTTLNGTPADLTMVVNANEDHWNSGDLSTSTGLRDLRERLQTCLRTHPGVDHNSFTVDFAGSNLLGRNFFIITAASSFTLHWGHVNTTAELRPIFGFTAADFTGTSVTAPLQSSGYWSPDQGYTRDTGDRPVLMGSVKASGAGSSRGSIVDIGTKKRKIDYTLLKNNKILQAAAVSPELNSTLEQGWVTAKGAGRKFRVYDDRTVRNVASYGTYRSKSALESWRDRENDALLWFDVTFDLRKVA